MHAGQWEIKVNEHFAHNENQEAARIESNLNSSRQVEQYTKSSAMERSDSILQNIASANFVFRAHTNWSTKKVPMETAKQLLPERASTAPA